MRTYFSFGLILRDIPNSITPQTTLRLLPIRSNCSLVQATPPSPGTCSRDRCVLQQLALNVHVKHTLKNLSPLLAFSDAYRYESPVPTSPLADNSATVPSGGRYMLVYSNHWLRKSTGPLLRMRYSNKLVSSGSDDLVYYYYHRHGWMMLNIPITNFACTNLQLSSVCVLKCNVYCKSWQRHM